MFSLYYINKCQLNHDQNITERGCRDHNTTHVPLQRMVLPAHTMHSSLLRIMDTAGLLI